MNWGQGASYSGFSEQFLQISGEDLVGEPKLGLVEPQEAAARDGEG